ncbi:MAG: hypothetical protein WCB68_20805 [Pyrinomonadaceae bacterium]
MSFNYHDKFFRPVSNSENGETGSGTIFHYRQQGNIVWATYRGGEVLLGTLLAKVDEEGRLDMRYQQVNRRGEWRTGTCRSVPQELEDGRYRLNESWQWTSGDGSSGRSVIEEVREIKVKED